MFAPRRSTTGDAGRLRPHPVFGNQQQKERTVVKVTITLIALCLGASHSLAQSGGAQDYRSLPANILTSRSFGVRQNTDGSVCFPAPWYDNCIYDSNPYSLDLYRIWGLYTLWNGVRDNDRPQSTPLSQATQPPAPPSPPAPVTPVIYEYDWPKQENAPAAFSIVTTGGTEYFAT